MIGQSSWTNMVEQVDSCYHIHALFLDFLSKRPILLLRWKRIFMVQLGTYLQLPVPNEENLHQKKIKNKKKKKKKITRKWEKTELKKK
jgi:hypothetical protein